MAINTAQFREMMGTPRRPDLQRSRTDEFGGAPPAPQRSRPWTPSCRSGTGACADEARRARSTYRGQRLPRRGKRPRRTSQEARRGPTVRALIARRSSSTTRPRSIRAGGTRLYDRLKEDLDGAARVRRTDRRRSAEGIQILLRRARAYPRGRKKRSRWFVKSEGRRQKVHQGPSASASAFPGPFCS